MAMGTSRPVTLLEANGTVMSAALLTWVDERTVTLDVPVERASRVMTWLRALVDGYAATDDAFGRLTFLDAVRDLGATPGAVAAATPESGPFTKPYFIGAWSRKEPAGAALPNFVWSEPQNAPLRKTHLNATHRAMGARMVPFGGWDMPVWYTGNLEEHRAVREAAGLFDVSHMGCWDVQGPEAATFLNMVLVNDVNYLDVGRSQYTASSAWMASRWTIYWFTGWATRTICWSLMPLTMTKTGPGSTLCSRAKSVLTPSVPG